MRPDYMKGSLDKYPKLECQRGEDCAFWCSSTASCDYILYTGHTRGCAVGEDCSCFLDKHDARAPRIDEEIAGRKK